MGFCEMCGKVKMAMEVAADSNRSLPAALGRFLQFEQRNLWRAQRFRNSVGDAWSNSGWLPERGKIFRVPCFRVQRRYLFSCEWGCDARAVIEMSSGSGPNSCVLFPIHPAELSRYAEFLSRVGALEAPAEEVRLLGTPTSSPRTLLMWPEGRADRAFFGKLSVNSRLLGDRTLTRRKVAISVGLSHLVQECMGQLPAGISFFEEPVGMTPRMLDSGVVFRSVPNQIRDGAIVAPLFALMGGEACSPVLLGLIRGNRSAAFEALEEVLLSKFARLWVDLVFDFGLILEAHGQDLLLELSPTLVPLGNLYYRDFEGLTVDWALRRAKGLREVALPHAFEWFSSYETWGYPLFQLISIKMRTSLFDYFHLFLAELEVALQEWRATGMMVDHKIRQGDLTSLFSKYLRKAIHEKFGMRESEQYDIHLNLTRFSKFLMRVRSEIMGSSITPG